MALYGLDLSVFGFPASVTLVVGPVVIPTGGCHARFAQIAIRFLYVVETVPFASVKIVASQYEGGERDEG